MANAHGFGQRYDLPLPLSLYVGGAALAVALSFVVVGAFVTHAPAHDHARVQLPGPLGRLIASPNVAHAAAAIALALFVVTVVAGFIGNADPYRNIAPTIVWIIGWVGLAFVSAFVGNVWSVINPWRTSFDLGHRAYRRVTRREPRALFRYPPALGAWPAFALLLAFAWLELVYPSPAVPRHIGWMLVVYSSIAWAGMLAFGRDAWLAHGELFSVVFGLFARFAPTRVRRADRQRRREATLVLRPFATGLLDSRPVSTSTVAFVLLVLSTVLYDGVLGTPEWTIFESSFRTALPASSDGVAIVIRTVGLVAFWAIFFSAYLAVCALVSRAAHRRRSTSECVQSFALTLVPIAIGYSVAHYLAYLIIQGQYIVPLLSDPFGFGWNLFGTAGYRVDVGVFGARFEWYAAVAAIVVGHLVAVYLAHVRSIALFGARGDALRSQIPLTALMVVYTLVSLTILAEPITETRPGAQPTLASNGVAIPSDAVLPEPGTGRLIAVGDGKRAREKLTYRMLGSAFQDGTATSAADVLYAYMFAYRWGARSAQDDAHYDPAIDAATAPMRKRLLGIRYVGTDTKSKSFRVGEIDVVRALFIFDVYTSNTPVDPEQDAALAPPWSTLPWEVVVLMEEAVSRGYAAFSKDEARRRGVEWLDIVRSKTLTSRLVPLVETFARDGFRPDALRDLVSADDARRRWNALLAFYRARGHFLVTNGPYVLKAWTQDSVTLDVFRDLSYPLGVGSYDVYAIPRRGFVTKVDINGAKVRLSADIETIMKYQRSYDIVRAPLSSLLPRDLQRDAPQCRYMLLDGAGRVVLAGAAAPTEDGTFMLDFAGKLAPADYTALAQISVNGNTTNAEIRRIPLHVAAGT
ncbi:MAG TPA: hypothetical protein VJ891_16235 [Casimicrobiaceae bacterium]|nr:hypothetical protein [Casimicrobiaceae bacterium]